MPLYDYFCPSNNQKVEVMHSMNQEVKTWGDVCKLAKCETGNTPEDAPVRRLLSAPRLSVPTSDSDYKSVGMSKLVKRDQGVYENVTAKDGEDRIVYR
ncbi:zinc ribbon domain-containing protein [Microcoleus sp. FACHB-672]|uniref:zinc ribbon domain-containing protein n=1 Tax=Microcoleus sp. FACHB-672 TaxID=2692825 RepID=UPI00168A3441|nr:zinc ribbon domain-containing protein [Microcoleus sp. FACHB-672]MBD2042515.1 zinc ribbon domain-containing protein [Microcoleus sp. FACHB-672]